MNVQTSRGRQLHALACARAVQIMLYNCTSLDAAAAAAAFHAGGGPQKTNCPSSHAWLASYTSQAECGVDIGHSGALIIGANKGFDCLGWARMLTSDAALTTHAWSHALSLAMHEKIKPDGLRTCGRCLQCRGPDTPLIARRAHWHSSMATNGRLPHVYCVEAMPPNARILERVSSMGPWNTSLHVIAAAAVDKQPASGTVAFLAHDARPGAENNGLVDEEANSKGTSKGGVQPHQVQSVRAETVDSLVRSFMDGVAPAILTIDTEGFDPLVLQGARETLGSGRVHYLEFEVHEKGPWKHTEVKNVLQYVEGFGFDCFWASRPLIPVSVRGGCWHESYEVNKTWSNMVCAHQANRCWQTALAEHAWRPA